MKLPTKHPNKLRAGNTEEMHKLALWIPTADVDELRIIAAEEKTTMSIIIRKLIKDYIK